MTIFGLFWICVYNLCGGKAHAQRIKNKQQRKKYVSENNTILLIEDDKIEKQMEKLR